MIRVAFSLIVTLLRWLLIVICGLVLMGALPLPLMFGAAWLVGRALFGFFSLPPFIVGVSTAAIVGGLLAAIIHDLPLREQRKQAVDKAQQAYQAQKWGWW